MPAAEPFALRHSKSGRGLFCPEKSIRPIPAHPVSAGRRFAVGVVKLIDRPVGSFRASRRWLSKMEGRSKLDCNVRPGAIVNIYLGSIKLQGNVRAIGASVLMPKPGATTEASFRQIVVDLGGHAAPLELWLSDEEIARQRLEEAGALISRPRASWERRGISNSGKLARSRARRCPSRQSRTDA